MQSDVKKAVNAKFNFTFTKYGVLSFYYDMQKASGAQFSLKVTKGGEDVWTGAVTQKYTLVSINVKPGDQLSLVLENATANETASSVKLACFSFVQYSDKYTVTYETNGADAIENQEVVFGGKVTLPAAPQKTGYTFDGWFTDKQLTQAFDVNTVVMGDINLFAKWNVNSYTVSFDTDGGTELASVSLDYNTVIALTAQPIKIGYTFNGWFTDADKKQPLDSAMKITQDITLYAQWAINSYTVSFEANGGKAVSPITAEYNTAITLPVCEKQYYDFNYWCIDAELTQKYEAGTLVVGDIKLYASFTVKTFTVKFETNGGSPVSDRVIEYKVQMVLPMSYKDGYTIDGWYYDEALTQVFYNRNYATDNMTLYAKWKINIYTITFDTNGAGTIEEIKQEYNKSIVLPETPVKEGYTFVAWYRNPGLTNVFVDGTPITKDYSLYAMWKVRSYTVSFETNGADPIKSQTIEHNGTITPPEDPQKTGYTFEGWFTNKELTVSFNAATAITKDITLYAAYKAQVLTVTFETNGGNDIAAAKVNYGEKLTPPEPVRAYSDFVGWYIDVDLAVAFDKNEAVLASMTLYAKWSIKYTVTFETNGGSAVESIKVLEGCVFDMPNNPLNGDNQFVGWFYDQTLETPYNSNVGVTSNITLYAKYLPATQGLAFTLLADDTYELSGIGTATDTDLVIPERYQGKPVTTIKNSALSGKNLTSVYMPDSITTIGSSAFSYNTELLSVRISENVTELPDYLFNSCINLSQFNIGNKVTKLGVNVVTSSVITSIYIPASVAEFTGLSFYDCLNVQSVVVSENNNYFVCVDNTVYSKDGKKVVYHAPQSSTGEVVIPEGVTTIVAGAFYRAQLTSIKFPSTLTTIEKFALSLSKISEAILPASLLTIGDYAFDKCYSLTKVTLCEGLTNIGLFAFRGCNVLKEIVLPASVAKHIQSGAFKSCSVLTIYCRAAYTGDNISSWYDYRPVYWYSETYSSYNCSYGNGFWHYVDGVPTIWVAETAA